MCVCVCVCARVNFYILKPNYRKEKEQKKKGKKEEDISSWPVFIWANRREEPDDRSLLFITAVRLRLVNPGIQVQPEVMQTTLYMPLCTSFTQTTLYMSLMLQLHTDNTVYAFYTSASHRQHCISLLCTSLSHCSQVSLYAWRLMPSQPQRSHKDKKQFIKWQVSLIHWSWYTYVGKRNKEAECTEKAIVRVTGKIPGSWWNMQSYILTCCRLKRSSLNSCRFLAEVTTISPLLALYD